MNQNLSWNVFPMFFSVLMPIEKKSGQQQQLKQVFKEPP